MEVGGEGDYIPTATNETVSCAKIAGLVVTG